MCGTPQYIAPEILKGDPYTKAVDWWSLGLLIYEMISGYGPFYTENEAEMYNLILRAPVEYPDWFTADAASFVSSLLNRDPAARPTPHQMKVSKLPLLSSTLSRTTLGLIALTGQSLQRRAFSPPSYPISRMPKIFLKSNKSFSPRLNPFPFSLNPSTGSRR